MKFSYVCSLNINTLICKVFQSLTISYLLILRHFYQAFLTLFTSTICTLTMILQFSIQRTQKYQNRKVVGSVMESQERSDIKIMLAPSAKDSRSYTESRMFHKNNHYKMCIKIPYRTFNIDKVCRTIHE